MLVVAACAFLFAGIASLAKVVPIEQILFAAILLVLFLLVFLTFFSPLILMTVVLIANVFRALEACDRYDDWKPRP
jgi:hypothetical protein